VNKGILEDIDLTNDKDPGDYNDEYYLRKVDGSFNDGGRADDSKNTDEKEE
jgi:hypothetical protein